MTIVTDAGLEAIAKMINGSGTIPAFTYMAIGSGSTAEPSSQTALVTELTANGAARAAATCTYEAAGKSKWVKTFTFTGNVSIREIGIFNDSSGGTMLLRRVLSSDKPYENGETVTITATHTVQRA